MRGIVYKDVCLFFKALDKWSPLVFGALAALFTAAGGAYAGLLFSAGLGQCVGMLSMLSFEKERKTDWERYQRTLPLGGGTVVAGKYASVLLLALLGAAASAASNLLFFAVYGRFEPLELGVSVLLAAVVPVAWAAILLPVYYWFGAQAVLSANMLPVLPLCGFFQHIGDGGVGWAPALVALAGETGGRWLLGLPAAGLALGLSWAVSAAGYCRRR